MRIKQALFLLQSIIFRVALQHGWHGPWHKEWNGAFVPDSQKCHPTYPYQFVPAWHPHAPAHRPCSSCITHAGTGGFAGSSCSLKKHIEMFLEVIGTIDPSLTTVGYVSTFHRSLAFCCYFFPISPISECLSFRFSPLHWGPSFQLIIMAVYASSCPHKNCKMTGGLVAEAGLARREWKRNCSTLMFKYLITASRKCMLLVEHRAG